MRGIALFFGGYVLMSSAAIACPDMTQYGYEFEATAQDLYTQHRFPAIAGGDYLISGCPVKFGPGSDSGDGYVSMAPDYTITISQLEGYRIDFEVVSECDSVLLINTGLRFWYYDDDDGDGEDAKISLSRPKSGIFDVWVGSYDDASCDATLLVETF